MSCMSKIITIEHFKKKKKTCQIYNRNKHRVPMVRKVTTVFPQIRAVTLPENCQDTHNARRTICASNVAILAPTFLSPCISLTYQSTHC